MIVKELIKQLNELDQEKEIEIGLLDNTKYCITGSCEGAIEDVFGKVVIMSLEEKREDVTIAKE